MLRRPIDFPIVMFGHTWMIHEVDQGIIWGMIFLSELCKIRVILMVVSRHVILMNLFALKCNVQSVSID